MREGPHPEPSCGTVFGGALLLAGLLLTLGSLGTCAITRINRAGDNYTSWNTALWLAFGTIGGMLLCAAGAIILAAAGRKSDPPDSKP